MDLGKIVPTTPSILTGNPTPLASIPQLTTALSTTGNLCCIPAPDTLIEKICPSVNQRFLAMILVALATQKYRPDRKTSFDDVYDYIIVGAGSAGAALAARLSEKECAKVLLLEAGSSPSILTEFPGLARLFLTTDMNWNFYTERQKNTGNGLYERKFPFPAGKAVGGSSIVNAMLYIRGNPKDYDEWEESGAEGWGWKNVFPYFLRLEDNNDPDIANNGYHNVSGPVTFNRVPYNPELRKLLRKAYDELKCPYIDPNGQTQIGCSDFQTNTRRGQRCSSAKAYLAPNDKRPNLHIVANAFVKKVHITNSTATGVYFDFDRTEHFVRARKEVILSAGAVNSPKLLMLSGVGPKETLKKHGIQVHSDLPVGHNLQDHCCTITKFVVKNLTTPIVPYVPKVLGPLSLLQFLTERSGPLTSPEAVFGLKFNRTKNAATREGSPNCQNYFIEGVPLIARLTFGIIPEVYKQVYGRYEFNSTMWCLASILRPKSRGYVSIKSSDPYVDPIIDPNYVDHPQDVVDIVECMKECLRVGRTKAMTEAGVKPFDTITPGCEQYKDHEDELLECEVRSVMFTLSHQAGTCKMGSPNDSTTVVDPKLRVHGIKGLRVADASIMPNVISGNTNIPCMMIGEKAADIIKETITHC